VDELKTWLEGFTKLAVIGIGSEIREDDGVGVCIINKLKDLKSDKFEPLIGGTTPENLSGVLRKLKPSHILFIDAAPTGKSPGTVSLIDTKDIGGITFSTHSFSLGKIAEYFRKETGAKIVFLGIEPKALGFGEALSPELRGAAEQVAGRLRAFLLEKRS
jgi:hydrogenase 3 maturation protease